MENKVPLTESGPVQLRDWMRRRGFLPTDAARYLEFTEPQMSKLLSGSRPNLINALKIERRAGIPVEAWVTSEEELETVGVASAPKRRVAK